MEFSDDRLLLTGGDQLHTSIQRSASTRRMLVGWKTTHLGILHPHCAHCPSVLNAIWSSKYEAPSVLIRHSPIPNRKLCEKPPTLSFSRPWARTRSEWLSFPGKRTYPVRNNSNGSSLSHHQSHATPAPPSCFSDLDFFLRFPMSVMSSLEPDLVSPFRW